MQVVVFGKHAKLNFVEQRLIFSHFEGCTIPSAICRDATMLERDKKLNNVNVVTKHLQCRTVRSKF